LAHHDAEGRVEINSKTGVDVTALVSAIKASIKKANVSSTNPGRDLQVTSIDLVLNTVATEKSGGGVELRVPFIGMKLKFGANVTHNDTHAINMTLIPEPVTRGVLRGTIEDNLVAAIQTIRAVVAEAAGGDDPFGLQQSAVEIAFAITSAGTLTLGVEGELSKTVSHTLRLHLGPAAPGQS
jgi:hypothetical protein